MTRGQSVGTYRLTVDEVKSEVGVGEMQTPMMTNDNDYTVSTAGRFPPLCLFIHIGKSVDALHTTLEEPIRSR